MANDLFGRLQPEEEQEIKKAEVKSNTNLEYLIKEYERFMEKSNDFFKAEELYEKIRFETKYLTSKNIEEFSLIIEKYQRPENFEFSGFYLSKLINDSKDENFTIHTNHLDSLIDNIGYKNKKNLTVNGNVGDGLGFFMENGNITINGDAGDDVGDHMDGGTIFVKVNAGDFVGRYMYDGEIHVYGNVGDRVGESMENGSITVNGNVGDRVGALMIDGTIYLNGKYKSLSHNINGGKIFHKGKLIVKEDKIIK